MNREQIRHCIICKKIRQLHKPERSSICIECCKYLAEIVERESLRKEKIIRGFNN